MTTLHQNALTLLNRCKRKFGERPMGFSPFEHEPELLASVCGRVTNGVAALDEHFPNWRDALNDGFSMEDPSYCIATVTTGNTYEGYDSKYVGYHKALAALGCTDEWYSNKEHEWAQAHGFDTRDETYVELSFVWTVFLGWED